MENHPTYASPQVRTRDVLILIAVCTLIGCLIKLPAVFGFSPDRLFFYERNAGLILFFGLSLFTLATARSWTWKELCLTLLIFLGSALFINRLPIEKGENASVVLACLHLPLMLWCLYGLIYTGFDVRNIEKRMNYIRFSGDLLLLTALILMAGVLLTGMTLALFSVIDMEIDTFYTEYVVLIGAFLTPIVASYLLRLYPSLLQKVASLLSTLFTPLVLMTLVLFLISMVATGKDPYGDRGFLLVFNLMLLAVVALIVFSVSKTTVKPGKCYFFFVLFALSLVALLVNVTALSAIVYRLGAFGFSPNRVAVLGSNLLLFGNLLITTFDVFQVAFKGSDFVRVERTVARYLPAYAGWTVLVVFGFPFIFNLN